MPVIFYYLGVLLITGSTAVTTGCADGKDGKPGFNSIPRIETINAGGACGEFTGLEIKMGLDLNRNNFLEDAEVDESQTNKLCAQRVDGVNSIIEQYDVAFGDLSCPFGGTTVSSGLDTNNNIVLDSNEIKFSKKICNGRDGFSADVNFVDVAIGTKGCTFGGKEIQAGLDTNRNGTLDASEVTKTNVICAVQVNSQKTLVINSVINPGSDCSYGGVKTQVGIDDNNNDILETSEVDSSINKCSQVALISGVNSIVRTSAASSLQCAYGGFIFESGLDTNYDAYLNTSERQSYEIICNGFDGYNSLVQPSAYFGYECGTYGGTKYETGLDLDFNGVLDIGEVENVSYTCHGEDGIDGLDGLDGYITYNSLINSYDAGSSCGNAGGFYLESGLDLDDDGVLDYSEVNTLNVICNGVNGYSTLVETYQDSYYCYNGGLVVESGLDYDEDGYLDSSEIVNTSYICRE